MLAVWLFCGWWRTQYVHSTDMTRLNRGLASFYRIISFYLHGGWSASRALALEVSTSPLDWLDQVCHTRGQDARRQTQPALDHPRSFENTHTTEQAKKVHS